MIKMSLKYRIHQTPWAAKYTCMIFMVCSYEFYSSDFSHQVNRPHISSYTQPPLPHHSPEGLMFYPTVIYNQLIQHNFTHTKSQMWESKGLSCASVKSTSDTATLLRFCCTTLCHTSFKVVQHHHHHHSKTHREEKHRGVLDVCRQSQSALFK